MEYCNTPNEHAANPDAFFWFERIANGNIAALAFMRTFWSFTHLYDDLVDNDKPVSADQAAGQFIEMLTSFLYNPFFVANKDTLYPLIVSMFNRWVDGDEWEQSADPSMRQASTVIRCGDVDLYHVVAFLTGGWENMRATKGARSYDTNKEA
jgi:hypothetical protein